jgi:hypothetical protein
MNMVLEDVLLRGCVVFVVVTFQDQRYMSPKQEMAPQPQDPTGIMRHFIKNRRKCSSNCSDDDFVLRCSVDTGIGCRIWATRIQGNH